MPNLQAVTMAAISRAASNAEYARGRLQRATERLSLTSTALNLS